LEAIVLKGHGFSLITKVERIVVLKGPASQAAEKLIEGRKKCQGTTLVVPSAPQNQRGLQPLRGAF
jgi:hypothetical protein